MMKRLTLIHIAFFIRSRGCVLCVVLCVVLGLGSLLPMAIVVEVEAVVITIDQGAAENVYQKWPKNLRFYVWTYHANYWEVWDWKMLSRHDCLEIDFLEKMYLVLRYFVIVDKKNNKFNFRLTMQVTKRAKRANKGIFADFWGFQGLSTQPSPQSAKSPDPV